MRARTDRRGVDLIADALSFGQLWPGEPNAVSNAIEYTQHRTLSHDAVIHVYDAAGNVVEMRRTYERQAGESRRSE
ncbi:MAG: hypothetical protein ACJ74Y_16190 [Bryobacteraceae bacterium]